MATKVRLSFVKKGTPQKGKKTGKKVQLKFIEKKNPKRTRSSRYV